VSDDGQIAWGEGLMRIKHAFLVYGKKLTPVVIVGVEGKQPWNKAVIPALKKALKLVTGVKSVRWDEFFIDGIYLYDGKKHEYRDPVDYFYECHRVGKWMRIIIFDDSHSSKVVAGIYRDGERSYTEVSR
jgi:hypothetical protein